MIKLAAGKTVAGKKVLQAAWGNKEPSFLPDSLLNMLWLERSSFTRITLFHTQPTTVATYS
ncbi:hypothetical protein AN477_13855 [Alicyclobacillus ferrooxydans]|uniref:Uncharacterized protein n=1 Tax=Alicyclobacillus ferrooxydans TaxID=471514 RepID=A0A0P9CU26_9BACL|nr:hypothetical protein AN477_13855 [Alicyclobacillus ferrooxydans]